MSPDERRVAFYVEKGLRILDIETPGAEALAFALNLRPTDWSRDGKFLILDQGTISELGKSNVVALDLGPGGEPAPIPIVATGANEYDGRLSPDGRFVAYVSDQTGRDEVWIASFPDGTSPERVSRNGGSGPRFRQDGRELFFVNPADEVVAVPISLGASIQVGEPVVLWSASFRDIAGRPEWEVLSNGERFLISDLGAPVARKGEIRRSTLNLVLDWPLLLRQ